MLISLEEVQDGVGVETARKIADCLLDSGPLGVALRARFGYDLCGSLNLFIEHSHACESPIELKFLEALHAVAPGYQLPIESPHFHPSMIQGDLITVMPSSGLYLFPQFEVTFSKSYRADFLLVVNNSDESKLKKMIVECDGHEFHERTKEQAARDKGRDREFTTAGYTVMRFTGSEITRDAIACAKQCLRFLAGWPT